MTSFIWDFDGTLADSYEAIRQALAKTYASFDLSYDEVWVMNFIIKESVGSLLRKLAAEESLDFKELLAFFNHQQESRDDMIVLMPFVKEALQFTKEKGIQNFIYTHKGATTEAVLEHLGIREFFIEVVTSANGFERKPHPEAVFYLLDKYELEKSSTYYIGDRRLDVELAENAGIASINLEQEESDVNHKINSLSQLPDLYDDWG